MKPSPFLITLLCASSSIAGSLTDIGNKFASSAISGDFDGIEKMLWVKSREKDAALESLKGAAGAIESGEITITHIDRELIIGDLGVTLLKIKSKSGELDYDPIIYVKHEGEWFIVPWADEIGLRAFAASRTEDEQIHLKLFNEWAHLLEKQLEQNAKQGGGGNPPDAE